MHLCGDWMLVLTFILDLFKVNYGKNEKIAYGHQYDRNEFKKTRQGSGQHTKYASTSRNNAKSVIVDKDDKYICIKSLQGDVFKKDWWC